MTDDLRHPRTLSSPRAPARSAPVMLAETVKLFRPRLEDMLSYIPTCNTLQKLSNWSIPNRQGFAVGFLPPALSAGAPLLTLQGWPQPLPAPGTSFQAASLLWVSLTPSSPTWGSWGRPAKRMALVSSRPAHRGASLAL